MNADIEDSSADVAAAIAAVESGGGASSAPSNVPEPQAFGTQPAATAAPQRDASGRFQSAAPAAPGASGPGVAAPVATPPAGGPPGAGAAPATPPAGGPAPGPAGPVALDPSKPPQGWRPEAREKWSTIPEDIRQEIVRREEASANGVARLRQQYEPAERIYNTVAQHSNYFQHIQRDPTEYLNEVIQIEQTIALGNPAQKMQALLDLGERYGVPLKQVIDSAMNGQLEAVLAQSHKHHKTPAQLPAEVRSELQQLRTIQQQMVDMAAENEYQTFVADPSKVPFLDTVSEDMAQLLENGVCQTYQEAYDLAVWRNPQTRQQAVAHLNGQNQQQGVLQRQAAAAAVQTPGSAPVSGVPAPLNQVESTEDSVRAAMAALANNR